MADPAHEATDKLIADMEKRLAAEYRQAATEVEEKLNDYWRRFEIKDEKWQIAVANGEKTPEEYRAWREGQLMAGQRWEDMKDELAEDLHNVNAQARRIVSGYQSEIYAENFNYGTFEVESSGNLNTGFTPYNREAVERIARDNPDVLPAPGKKMSARLAENKDLRWQEGKIQSVTMQSILQGESIPNMARRISREMAGTNYKSAVRYARTASTAAENAGKQDAYQRAEDLGIEMMQEWRAVFDERTRHEHRVLDGQKRRVGEPFEVEGYEIMYPGDPSADPEMIWNCRCTLGAVVAGLEPQARKYRSSEAVGGMSYEEWKESRKETSRDIEYQTRVGEAIRQGYVNEYKEMGDD